MFLPIILMLFALGPKQHSEPKVPRPIELQASSTKTLGIPFFNFWGEPKSDSDGFVYFHAATSDYGNSTILGISTERPQPLVFSLKGEFAKATSFEAFDVTPSGIVYILTTNADHRAILFEFDRDGDLNHHTELNIPSTVVAESFAVFEATGNVVVWGFYGSRASEQEKGKTFAAIVDSSGKLLRRLTDDKKRDSNAAGDKPSESCAYLGIDGNMYILKSSQIIVLSAGGTIRHRISIAKPEKNALATKLIVSDGVAAVWLQSDPAAGMYVGLTLETIDVSTGRVLGIYSPSEELGTNAVSFSRSGGFVFFKNLNSRIGVLTATVQ